MTTVEESLEHRSLLAPKEDGAVLIDPPLEGVAEMVRGNQRRRAERECDVLGRPLSDLVRQARREIVDEAQRWTSAYRSVDRNVQPECPIFLAGHQPQIFHPGVWLKNFALGELARRHGALGINLLVDSDTIKSTSLRTPRGTAREPSVESIPFDAASAAIPYEERRIIDRGLFAQFGGRVTQRLRPLVPEPLIQQYWPMVVARSLETDNLGACLAQARHQLEGEWGVETLEIPQSRVCELASYRLFMLHLLAELPRLLRTYNEVVRGYRRTNGIRGTARPVPDLTIDGEWLEAPFWVWTLDDPRRRRLFVRRAKHRIILTDRQRLEVDLPFSSDGPPDRAMERLEELTRRGVKIRCRALITTLWARLVLGDLFLHGIGGAKYDQVTDALIARFFGLVPPKFMVLSATLHLPVAGRPDPPGGIGPLKHQLRELTFHPELFVDRREKPEDDPRADDLARLIAEKHRWVHTEQTPANARTRYREIRRINQALQPYVGRRRGQLTQRLAETRRATAAEAILSWREYGFCLHSGETLRNFYSALLPKDA